MALDGGGQRGASLPERTISMDLLAYHEGRTVRMPFHAAPEARRDPLRGGHDPGNLGAAADHGAARREASPKAILAWVNSSWLAGQSRMNVR